MLECVCVINGRGRSGREKGEQRWGEDGDRGGAGAPLGHSLWAGLAVGGWWCLADSADCGSPILNVAVPWLRLVCQANRISEDAFTLSWQLDRQVEVEVVGSGTHKNQSHSMECRAPIVGDWRRPKPHMAKKIWREIGKQYLLAYFLYELATFLVVLLLL